MKTNVKMNCPNCRAEIELDQLLVTQFRDSIKNDLNAELQQREAELNQKRIEFNELSKKLTLEKEGIDELVNSRVKVLLSSKEEAIKDAIRKQIDEEKSTQLQELENELVKKSAQLRDLNGTKAQLEKLKREMEEAETRIILQKEKELTTRLDEARTTIREQVHQETFLKMKEREGVINQLKEQLDIAKRKADQGSMQLQGEVQELFLEQSLREMYPIDEIIEIGKGQLGADCIQVIKTNNGNEIGKILWESKNTQSFPTDKFVNKLKQDNLTTKADIMVIVTNVMPKDVTGKFAIVNGVWICSKNSIRELSLALRYALLKVQSVVITQHDKQSKSELLFDYITSENFKSIIESILDNFKKIQDSHYSEKLKISRLWKERELLLEKILLSNIEFYSEIKGIAGVAVHEIPMLQFRNAG